MPTTFNRSDRISAELRRLVGTLVHEVVRDHALPSVSVSDVEASRELDTATVYVTALMAEQGLPRSSCSTAWPRTSGASSRA